MAGRGNIAANNSALIAIIADEVIFSPYSP
jgi:hypothetical protein